MHCVYFPTIMSAPSEPKLPAKMASYLPLRTVRLREAISVVQAVHQAPSLAVLAKQAKQSAECLRLVTPLIPASMRSGVQAGPLALAAPPNAEHDGHTSQWCLLAANSAVAAKLRQLAPALAAHLRTHGHDVQDIRIKIAMQTSR
jgi:hypothetical protein